MKKKNNFLSKGILFLLLSFLLGCSSTNEKEKEVKSLAILSRYPTLEFDTSTQIVEIQTSEDLKKSEDSNEQKYIPSIKYINLDFKTLIKDNNDLSNLIIIDELEKSSAFLAGYFNYLNDYISDSNIDNIQKEVTDKFNNYKTIISAYRTIPTYLSSEENNLFNSILENTIPNILSKKVEKSMNQSSKDVFKVLLYRQFLIEKVGTLIDNEKGKSDSTYNVNQAKIKINNIFMHNVGLIYLWCYANDVEISSFKKEYSKNKEDMDNLFQNHLDYLTIKPLNEFPIIHEKN